MHNGNNCVDIIKYGVRNSLVTCEPPTASSARVIGSNEAFEPFTSICS
jgi:ribonucleoside-diphosphate reductase alpha chain